MVLAVSSWSTVIFRGVRKSDGEAHEVTSGAFHLYRKQYSVKVAITSATHSNRHLTRVSLRFAVHFLRFVPDQLRQDCHGRGLLPYFTSLCFPTSIDSFDFSYQSTVLIVPLGSVSFAQGAALLIR